MGGPGIITDSMEIRGFFDGKHGKPDGRAGSQGWSIHLRLGPQVYISSEPFTTQLAGRADWVCIKPGDFALLLTEECVRLPPDVMAFISLRFGYKRKGLINVSGFHVDPTYYGRIIFSVFNAGPRDIVFRRGDHLFMMFCQRLESGIHEDCYRREWQTGNPVLEITSEDVNAICGKSVTLSQNASRIDKIEANFKYLSYAVGILATICVALIGLLFRKG